MQSSNFIYRDSIHYMNIRGLKVAQHLGQSASIHANIILLSFAKENILKTILDNFGRHLESLELPEQICAVLFLQPSPSNSCSNTYYFSISVSRHSWIRFRTHWHIFQVNAHLCTSDPTLNSNPSVSLLPFLPFLSNRDFDRKWFHEGQRYHP